MKRKVTLGIESILVDYCKTYHINISKLLTEAIIFHMNHTEELMKI